MAAYGTRTGWHATGLGDSIAGPVSGVESLSRVPAVSIRSFKTPKPRDQSMMFQPNLAVTVDRPTR